MSKPDTITLRLRHALTAIRRGSRRLEGAAAGIISRERGRAARRIDRGEAGQVLALPPAPPALVSEA